MKEQKSCKCDERVMYDFEKLLPEITKQASYMSYKWNNKFTTNELVNEAWLRGRNFEHQDIPIVINRAKFDMIDYIRKKMGRKKVYTKKGKIKIKKPKPKHITNVSFDKEDSFGHGYNYLDGEEEDKNLLNLENEELIIKLLLGRISEKQLQAIYYYYFKEMTMEEVGGFLDKSEPNIYKLIKKGINECKRKYASMKI